MRIGEARIWLVALLCCAASGVAAPAAQAGFGVEEKNFEAGTCTVSSCTYASVEADHELAYTQAAGHPQYGLTAFEFNSTSSGLGQEPIGNVKRVRVDIPPGLAADPEALLACPVKTFDRRRLPRRNRSGQRRTHRLRGGRRRPDLGARLQPPAATRAAARLRHPRVGAAVANEHIFLEGHVSWNTDFHEYFEINNITKSIPLLKSKLIFNGRAGEGNFLTLPSVCSSDHDLLPGSRIVGR